MAIDDFDIHETPSCPDPSAQTETNIAQTSVDLGWTENGSATTWDIEYGPTGFTKGSGTTVSTSSNPYSLTGLSAKTAYDWYVRADCGGGSTSNWIGPKTFTTLGYSKVTNGKTTKCSPGYSRSGSGWYFYDKYSFTVPTSGNYDILANWTQGSGTAYDGYLYLYENSFDPTNPASNKIAEDDDNDNGNGSTYGSKIASQSLTSGTTYIVVGTSYYDDETIGTMEFKVEGPSMATANSTTDYNGVPASYTHDPPSTDGTTRTASYECDDQSNWTHYYYDGGTSSSYDDDVVILSIKKNGENIGTVGDGTFSVTLAGAAGVSHITNPPANYVSSWHGWYVFNRYWKVTPTSQPSSGVNVIYYYTTADYTALQNAINDEGGTPPTNHTKMYTFKINNVTGTYDPDPANGHSGVPLASANGSDGCWIYSNDASASTSNWAYTDLGNDFHSMETVVEHFSGGGGGSGETDGDGDGSPLPINLLSISGRSLPEYNLINWTTASEINTTYFEIERSANAKDNITTVGSTKASGNSNLVLTYEIKDNDAPKAAYYRLRSYDSDGKQQISQWIYIQRDASDMKIVNLFPNPANSTVSVNIISPVNITGTVEIRDVVGRVVYSQKTELVKGSRIFKIDIANLESGTYYFTIVNGNTKLTKVFIKE
jgi:hypothetical protein